MLLQADALQDKDELLGASVTDDLITEAEEYLRAAAASLGVAWDAVQLTYYVRRFLTVYVFRELCIRKSYTGAQAWGSGGVDDKDSYAGKYSFYRDEMKRLEASMTAAALTGEAVSNGYGSVELYRG